MRAIKPLILIVLCAGNLSAQNLIPNPSFEDTTTVNNLYVFPKYWNKVTKSSPDYLAPYYNNVPQNYSGFQNAKTGLSYMGIVIYPLYANTAIKRSREYIQTKLSDTLAKDSAYCLRLYVNLADSMRYASKNQLGVYLSNNKVSSNDQFHLPYTPQIIVSPDSFIREKENWVEYTFEYQASGGEEHITIGNFNDSNIVDTLFVGGGKSELAYEGTYYYIDDVYLGNCDSLIGLAEITLASQINIYPNPTKENLFIRYEGNEKLQFQLYNSVGQAVESRPQQTRNQVQLFVGHLPKGIYLLEIIAGEERIIKKIIKQ